MSDAIVRYLPSFADDMNKFKINEKNIIRTAIDKIIQNPETMEEGGCGHALCGNPENKLLYAKIIFTDIRIVYQLIPKDNGFLIIFVSVSVDKSNLD